MGIIIWRGHYIVSMVVVCCYAHKTSSLVILWRKNFFGLLQHQSKSFFFFLFLILECHEQNCLTKHFRLWHDTFIILVINNYGISSKFYFGQNWLRLRYLIVQWVVNKNISRSCGKVTTMRRKSSLLFAHPTKMLYRLTWNSFFFQHPLLTGAVVISCLLSTWLLLTNTYYHED